VTPSLPSPFPPPAEIDGNVTLDYAGSFNFAADIIVESDQLDFNITDHTLTERLCALSGSI